jgi:hypothetical protein
MSAQPWRTATAALAVLSAFLLGLQVAGGSRAFAEGGTVTLPPQGAGGGGGTADSDRNMIAVTGTSSTGAAVLYLVDTRQKRLAIYQASGKNIELVAARNIEYDLKLDAYRDTTAEEYAVARLRALWLKNQGGARPGDDGK